MQKIKTMKKTLPFLLVILSLIVIPSCKKGEDDPFISFRSRDARITAKWKLVNYESQSNSSGGSSSSSVLNGSILTVTNSGGSYSYSYSEELEINSDGTYNLTTIRDGDISTSTYFWYWLNDSQKKTSIGLGGLGTFKIDKLSHNELILRDESSILNVSNGNTFSTNPRSIKTFERQ